MAGVEPDSMGAPTTAIIIITTITTVAPITAIGVDQPPGITGRGAPMAIGADQLPGAAVPEVQRATVAALPPGAAVQAPGMDQAGVQDLSTARNLTDLARLQSTDLSFATHSHNKREEIPAGAESDILL